LSRYANANSFAITDAYICSTNAHVDASSTYGYSDSSSTSTDAYTCSTHARTATISRHADASSTY
jgi:hypothetical protein